MKYIREFLKHHKKVRRYARKFFIAVKQLRYKVIAAGNSIDDKKILFEVFMGRQYGCNPRAIYEQMINDKRFEEFKFVWAFKDVQKKTLFSQLDRAEVVKYKSKAYLKCCASSKYIITNSNMDYMITKKKDQVFLQTWHGTPLKKLRCDIEVENGNAVNSLEEIRFQNNIDIIRYDYFLSPSAFATEKFISAFNLKKLGRENVIIETGYPRNDKLFNHDREDIKNTIKRLGLPKDKKIILYAPTFRDNQHESDKGYVLDLNIDFDNLKNHLGEEYIILFRAHYFVANKFDFEKYKGFIYDVSSLDDITDLYIISDLLITDYSSVFFDYANLRKPILFYMYDMKEYINDIRGFYIDIEELPGTIVTKENDLIDAIENHTRFCDEKYDVFNGKFNSLDDGNAANRVLRILF